MWTVFNKFVNVDDFKDQKYEPLYILFGKKLQFSSKDTCGL